MGQFKGIKRCNSINDYNYLKNNDLIDADTLYVISGSNTRGISVVRSYYDLPAASQDMEGATFCVLESYDSYSQGLYTCLNENLNYTWKMAGGGKINSYYSYDQLPYQQQAGIAICEHESYLNMLFYPAGLYVSVPINDWEYQWKCASDNGIKRISQLDEMFLTIDNIGSIFYNENDNEFYKVTGQPTWTLSGAYYDYSDDMFTNAYNNGDFEFYTLDNLGAGPLVRYVYDEGATEWMQYFVDNIKSWEYLDHDESFDNRLKLKNYQIAFINYEHNTIKACEHVELTWSPLMPSIYQGTIDANGVVTKGAKISDFKGIIVLDNTSVTPTSIPTGYSLEIAEA